MTFDNIEALTQPLDPAFTLEVLKDALVGKNVPAPQRVFASDDSRSPDEGLALLQAYVALPDRKVRQAILDLVLAISGVDPRR